MPIYMIEREIPGASKLTNEELQGITDTSNQAVASLDEPYGWCRSYVAGDKIYCLHEASSPEVVREHARLGGFPVTLVSEVVATFGEHGPQEFPRF